MHEHYIILPSESILSFVCWEEERRGGRWRESTASAKIYNSGLHQPQGKIKD